MPSGDATVFLCPSALLFSVGTDAATEMLHTMGTAQLENHVVILRADVDLARVPPGSYFLGLRQPGLEWTRFPVRVF